MFAKFAFQHARRCYELGKESGQTDEALFGVLGAILWGMRLAPEHTQSRLTELLEHPEDWFNLSNVSATKPKNSNTVVLQAEFDSV